MSKNESAPLRFDELGLSGPVLKALEKVGYESPTPIQAAIIPHLLSRKDVVGQAQTGTGKTAAFALPALSNIDSSKSVTQILTLTPTRELAIQVAEAFQKYAAAIPNFHVLPIYGGQEYGTQIRQLNRGAQVVVGTPGRVMDHIRKGTLKLNNLQCLVLDEADEMLRVGFIDDVEWVIQQCPKERQIALFSATMPTAIRRIAQDYLVDPQEITIKVKTATAETIAQRFCSVSQGHKMDALTRILEVEHFDGMIIFVRTKSMTLEVAEKLEARGYAAAALNGDIPQAQRERTINRLKKAELDIVVATDVAARGLDVERISHVINYDIPSDTEAYIHRIGRTGRAGRTGHAILFVTPRERRMLTSIERATKKPIDPMDLPTPDAINSNRIARFKQRITDTLTVENLDFYRTLIEQYEVEFNVPAIEIAAALSRQMQGNEPFLYKNNSKDSRPVEFKRDTKENFRERPPREKGPRQKRPAVDDQGEIVPMEQFRIEVGREHGVAPKHIVGAIANEAGLESQFIGAIEIFDKYSFVDLPEGMPDTIFKDLKNTRVLQHKMDISRVNEKRNAPKQFGGNSQDVSKPKKPKPKNEKLSLSKPRSSKPGGKSAGKPGFKPKGKPAKRKDVGSA